jgi:hypothetical protein
MAEAPVLSNARDKPQFRNLYLRQNAKTAAGYFGTAGSSISKRGISQGMLSENQSAICVLRHALIAAIAVAAFSGCQKPSVSQVTGFDPATATKQAWETYDQNKDGKLSADEMTKSPPLSEGAKRADTNRDGILTVDEFKKRLDTAHASRSLHLFQVRVTSGGKPLRDASISFVPESFLGEGLQSYSGKTTADGLCALEGDNKKSLGIPDGYYTIRIVQAEQGIDSLRGCEIAPDTMRDIVEVAL